MNICNNCGVELEDGLNLCPLCGKNSDDPGLSEPGKSNYPSDIIHLYRKESRRYAWELIGIIAFSCIAVCTIVDLLVVKGLKWSLYTDVSIAAFWIFITLSRPAFRKSYIIIPGIVITILIMLFLFDLFSPASEWFINLGLPLTLAAGAAVSIIFLLYKSAHFKGFNIIAAALLVISILCIATEMIIDNFIKNQIDIRWSLIEAVSVIPIVLIFIFLHYRLKRGKNLDSFFHV